jgi:toxin ParE1/3/4
MKRVVTTPEAEQDLVEIALYTATSQGSLKEARAFVFMLQDKFMLLAEHPDVGRVREELTDVHQPGPPALRSFPVNKYVVFYEPTAEGVRILRVLHASRDLPPLL